MCCDLHWCWACLPHILPLSFSGSASQGVRLPPAFRRPRGQLAASWVLPMGGTGRPQEGRKREKPIVPMLCPKQCPEVGTSPLSAWLRIPLDGPGVALESSQPLCSIHVLPSVPPATVWSPVSGLHHHLPCGFSTLPFMSVPYVTRSRGYISSGLYT